MNIATIIRDTIEATPKPEGAQLLARTYLPQPHVLNGSYGAQVTAVNLLGESMQADISASQVDVFFAGSPSAIEALFADKVKQSGLIEFMAREPKADAA